MTRHFYLDLSFELQLRLSIETQSSGYTGPLNKNRLNTVNIVYWCFAQQDECSFVSLRDVDRALTVTSWFLQQAQDSGTLFDMLDEKLNPQREDDEDEAAGESLDSLRSQEEEEEEVGILRMAVVMDNFFNAQSTMMVASGQW